MTTTVTTADDATAQGLSRRLLVVAGVSAMTSALALPGAAAAVPRWQLQKTGGRRRRPHDAAYAVPAGLRPVDVHALAAVVAGEARGECLRGQQAVACVVLNRVRSPAPIFAGDTSPATAVYRRHQFHPLMSTQPTADDVAVAVVAAANWARGQDPSAGATAFLARGDHPRWARRLRPLVVIGGHRFYRQEQILA